ncbi:Zn-ribbon domain-containing OB-fold protein [Pigmentiphaga soli]|uniref:Zn-ribbon domain-containing OB-fold protein n=1 Tax=Pigmentiphaga soli TaxID=1007095 RepID=A0ABP8GEJ3_9BURK
MKYLAPDPHGIAAEHWRAAAEGRLALPYCMACAAFHWPPRAACPRCGGRPGWRDAGGEGRLAAWSVVRRPVHPALRDEAPYAVGLVELDEGVRLFTHVAAADPGALRAGMRLRCEMRATLDPAIHVPVFIVEGS